MNREEQEQLRQELLEDDYILKDKEIKMKNSYEYSLESVSEAYNLEQCSYNIRKSLEVLKTLVIA